MSEYVQLSKEELSGLDSLIEHVKADASFITAIVPVLVRAVPVVLRVAQVVTPAVVGEAARLGAVQGPGAKMFQGKASAQDLIDLRKSLTGGK